MADETSKEKVIIDFSTNANAIKKDTDNLRASIDTTVTSTDEQTKAIELQDVAYKTLKTQLREANNELTKSIQLYGETSQQAINAAEGVAELKDQIGFAKDLSESFNPDQKFKALVAATQVAGTGLQGVTAGMALFGGESEDTQKQLLKVQAAMAFSDAISNLSDVADQWAILKTSISQSTVFTKANTAATGIAAMVQNIFTGSVETTTAGFKALKFAIAATGIGLLVVGLGLVVANFEKISKWAMSFGWIKATAGWIGDLATSITDFIGVTSEADRAIDMMKKNADTSIALNKKFLAEHGSQLDEFTKQKIAAKDKYNEAIKEDGANQVALAKELNRELASIEYSRGDEQRKIADDNAKKAREDAEKRAQEDRDNAKKLADEKLAEEKRIADEKLAPDMASAREAIKILDDLAKEKETPAQKEQREFEEKKLVLEANNLSIEANNIYIEELSASHLAKMTEIERIERENKAKEENDYWANESDKATKRLADEKSISDAKLAQKKSEQDSLNALGNAGINAAKDLFGKNKAVQKGIIVTEGAVALGKLATGVVEQVGKDNTASPLTLGMPWSGVHIATGALGAASIIANTSKALQAVGGGSAPSAPSLPSAPSGIGATPQTGFQASSENQIATSIANSQQQQPIIKAFVVGSEVTTQQNLDSNLVKQNSFGGVNI